MLMDLDADSNLVSQCNKIWHLIQEKTEGTVWGKLKVRFGSILVNFDALNQKETGDALQQFFVK